MNVLMIGTGVPIKNNKNGGAGMAVLEISERLAITNSVHIIPRWSSDIRIMFKEFNINNVTFIKRKISLDLLYSIIKYTFSCSFNKTLKFATGFRKIQYCFMYVLDRSHIETIVKKNNFDVIHIHGLALHHLPYIDSAMDHDIPLICTSHGSVYFNPNIETDYKKEFEKYILNILNKSSNTSITTVSSALKKTLIDEFNLTNDNIHVILNGVNSNRIKLLNKNSEQLTLKHDIFQKKIVILQVSSLTKNKNHSSVLIALSELNENIRNNLIYVIIGDGPEAKTLKNFVSDHNLNNNVLFTGHIISGDELSSYYQISDLFILPSISEGLPLVFLEAMSMGLPIITYKDLHGVSDLYHPDCFEIIDDRSTESMKNAIINATLKKWDKQKIIEHSKSFTLEKTSEMYAWLYQKMTNQGD